MQRHDGSRWLLVGSGIVVVLLSSAACGVPSTFGVQGRFGGTADVVDEDGACHFELMTYEVGDDVVLRGADNAIVATDHLRKGPDSHSGRTAICDLAFQFDNVRPDDVAYQLTVDGGRPIIVTEQQLRGKNGLVVSPDGPTRRSDPNLRLRIQG